MAASDPSPHVPRRPARRIGEPPTRRTSEGIARRGFASMDPALHRALASKGGQNSHAGGQGFKWNAEQAKEAGRKGGLVSRRKPPKPKEE